LMTVCLTRRALENPDDVTSFWGLVQIPNLWYPVGFVAFFWLLSMRTLFDLIAALAIGYAYPYLCVESMLPSDATVIALENKFGCACRSLLGGSWVSASEAHMPDEERARPPHGNLPDLGTGHTPSSEVRLPQTGASFVAFSGNGHRLGSAQNDDTWYNTLSRSMHEVMKKACTRIFQRRGPKVPASSAANFIDHANVEEQ